MKSQQTPQAVACGATQADQVKQPYKTPVLSEHGSAKDVTLQTFFGTFSPPASD